MQEPERKKDLAELLKLVKKETDNCIRCGECRTVCPVFREDPKERYTARGKMAIAEELASGNLEFNGKVREAFENCLLCTGCASQCSSGARADKVILAVRRTFAKELGIPPIKKMIGKVLSQPGKILDLETKAGSLLQPLLFRSVPHESGLYRRFAMPMVDRQQYVPHIAETPFRNRNNFSGKPGQPVVMFYTGCMINYAMTEIGESLIKVLNALDISVSIPENQACCGTPMLTSGDGESVKNQAEKNIKAFCDGSDTPIVVACASCGHMLKHGYLEFLGKDPVLSKNLREKLKNISERTMDITEYLIGHVGEKKLKSIIKQDCTTTPFSVTYHDPCHLRKAQGITAQPRDIIRIASQSVVREMEKPEACCGLGGTYSISNMKLSKEILSRKTKDAASTGASCMTTACPGCIMQLRDGLRRRGESDMKVKHVIQLLAESIG